MTLEPAEVLDAGSALLAELNTRIPEFHGLVAPDVVLGALGLPIARVNSASATRFTPETADRRIDEVIAWFDARGLPFVWRLGPADRPSDLQDRLLAKAFTLDPDEMPGMAAPLDDLPPLDLPPGVTVEPVLDREVFGQWQAVLVAGFGMPAPVGEAFGRFADLGFDDSLPTRGFLARLEGEPVATSLGVLAGGGLVILNVTTLAEARGRGIGRAVTLATMHAGAREGATLAVLQSTEPGFGVYRALGFEEFGRYRVLARLPD